MVGGNQLKSKRSKLREMVGKTVALSIIDSSLEEDAPFFGVLEYKGPDKGYFLEGSNIRIMLPHIRTIDTKLQTISVNSSESLTKYLTSYHGVKN
jgi:hypothetical protein